MSDASVRRLLQVLRDGPNHYPQHIVLQPELRVPASSLRNAAQILEQKLTNCGPQM